MKEKGINLLHQVLHDLLYPGHGSLDAVLGSLQRHFVKLIFWFIVNFYSIINILVEVIFWILCFGP